VTVPHGEEEGEVGVTQAEQPVTKESETMRTVTSNVGNNSSQEDTVTADPDPGMSAMKFNLLALDPHYEPTALHRAVSAYIVKNYDFQYSGSVAFFGLTDQRPSRCQEKIVFSLSFLLLLTF
jgi:hypothetical protein